MQGQHHTFEIQAVSSCGKGPQETRAAAAQERDHFWFGTCIYAPYERDD